MSVTINADTSDGLKFTSDTSGEIKLQSAGADIATVTSSGITMASGKTITGNVGKVLQVVNATTATQVSSNSGTYVDTGLTATITPSSSSNKILVIVDQTGCGKLTSDTTLQLKLLRGSTDLMWLERSGGWTGSGATNFFGSCSCNYLDSPSTTSAVTYKTQMAAFSAASTVYTQYNVGAGNPTSTITLMEIQG